MDAWRREATAVALQGALIARRLIPRRLRRPPGPGVEARGLVVFVHGLLAAGPVFDPLRRRVARELGLATLDITYGPHRHLESVAAELQARIEEVAEPHQPVDLVGHSLGGLIARWYLQQLGGRGRRLVTIATPHAGTPVARWVPGPMGRALRPGSPWLRRLGDSVDIPHLVVVADGDRLVPPQSAAAVRDARIERFPGLGHNEVLYDPRVQQTVVEALAGR